MKHIKGFTLIELMVVITVMAIFLTLVIVNIDDSRATNRDTVRSSHVQEIRIALEEYKVRCGEYPNTLLLSANNGCPAGFSLGNVLKAIPVNPYYSSVPPFHLGNSISSAFNGYYYAGLSTRSGGPCYEYHVGVPLEGNYNGSSYTINSLLSEDHDCAHEEGKYAHTCTGSQVDFDGSNDSSHGVYDFRSAKNC